ncbi:nucleotidyl transferase AbiEii/AbiGii toxin family protein [Curtobacterium ammoniigenes]|uniref:nucleotidyl transferase AbiEii/AbiGii toxin family protein n=1 Tax=Curtobacterium ammoniigenes TaxID=395387 RepID=UPI000A55039E|nr:nucleotidyl transferase AbiEii/AbiGii toxin family protein [Curtobacterium ammoniigenes]
MTPPAPMRDTPEGRAYNDLRNLAKRHGREPSEYFTLYALEGFLTRLAASPNAEDFVLKGGVLMAAFAVRRPTRDIDLAALGFANDVAEVERRIRGVLASPVGDGLSFDLESVSAEEIREDAAYSGVRVRVVARLVSAVIALHVDLNFGDPIWPAPTEAELPLLLGGTLRLRGYPDHMVLAEKIMTAIDRGEQNTRWRDFVDIAALTRTRQIPARDLREALNSVAAYRDVTLEPLAPLLEGMPSVAQRKWATWRRKQRLTESTPAQFEELLVECIAFADPVLAGATALRWDPEARAWR